MSARPQRLLVDGPVGKIEVLVDRPDDMAGGLVLVGHPHPLFGGTVDNKVAATLARAFVASGWIAVRPNFRGVGASDGLHDNGVGERDDFLHLLAQRSAWLADAPSGLPLALAGFSFGSFVAASTAQQLARQRVAVRHLVLVGAAAGKWPMPDVAAGTLVIHGERDQTIPLAAVFDWARPQELPVIVFPGADHFFHRRLTQVKQVVLQHLAGANAGADPGVQ